MDKVSLLSAWDGELMHEFSKRSLQQLIGRSLLTIHLPFLTDYLEANVMKEVEKDRLIIEEAAKAFTAGVPLTGLDVDEIFEKTKIVDRAFVSGLLIPSISVVVKYEDIGAVRKSRILRLSCTAFDLLKNWQEESSVDEAMKRTYGEQEFRDAILDMLHLYNRETKLLGKSIRFFPPFNRALNQLAETLFEAMEKVANEMADAYAQKIYGQEGVPCPNPI